MQISPDQIAFERRKRQIFEAVRGLKEHQQDRALSDYAETEPELARAVRQLLHANRQRLVLVVSDAALVRRVVLLTKLEDAVPLVDTVDDALAALNNH